jgi:calcineurin-like phosphoesterase family protein
LAQKKPVIAKLFFTSDLHFGHRNILKHCPNRERGYRQPFESIKEHDEMLIKNWNKLVRPEDTVIVAGDVKMCGNTYAKECLARLNGKKILVRGNHDLGRSKMMRLGFDWACDEMHVNIGGTRVLISHYPYRLPKWKYWWLKFKQLFYKREIYDFRKMYRRPIDHGMILLHGHTHQEKKVVGRMIHVGVDSWNLHPVSEDMIQQYIAKIKKETKVRG